MTAQNLPEQEAFQKWLFGFEKQNPFLSTFEYLYMVFHQKKIKKEEITCQNKELFNANQSKTSILTKQLNQLISRSLQNSNDIRVGKFGIFNGSVSSQVK
ncbi:unnamed protein product (macronuclear) [Paramecium tetraurelia]|uniref:Uncharacterized protein n=1 Tax=Paramecium tetraurelia TaxID=5888 RepID=A0C8Z2_PARTE|nr:uncharacterized protein GSPATT00006565001 [Paramecium tetraurelia]CAK67259.1 unnamed protein product [Paramecium tetraurelia]|eukprot:XP_001434656.1 hypothetical protein (macronuclear) [Paramecium tetraurelia strain d4-2]